MWTILYYFFCIIFYCYFAKCVMIKQMCYQSCSLNVVWQAASLADWLSSTLGISVDFRNKMILSLVHTVPNLQLLKSVLILKTKLISKNLRLKPQLQRTFLQQSNSTPVSSFGKWDFSSSKLILLYYKIRKYIIVHTFTEFLKYICTKLPLYKNVECLSKYCGQIEMDLPLSVRAELLESLS